MASNLALDVDPKEAANGAEKSRRLGKKASTSFTSHLGLFQDSSLLALKGDLGRAEAKKWGQRSEGEGGSSSHSRSGGENLYSLR